MATLTFYGAAQQVTGSCYLVATDKQRVLLDCGLFQGTHDVEQQNDQSFPFDPRSIDAVVLSHAHLDHSGLLPKLVREGFSGPIYATPPTCALIDIMLKDAAFLQERENGNYRNGKDRAPPLYTVADVEQTLTRCRGIDYGVRFKAAEGIDVCLRDAGHILGSAIVELWVAGRKLVYSGDLGHDPAPLMHDPHAVRGADVLLMESTYGDRDHRSLPATIDEFTRILEQAASDAGNVLIPAFAIGRTQEILYYLSELQARGQLRQQKVFLDSPMAIAATELHQKYQELLTHKVPGAGVNGRTRSVLPQLQYTRTTEESIGINRISGGAVIIAGSGMCTGGRIRHHLKNNLWRAAAHVVFVGFQARGTLGRALVDGAASVKLFGDDVPVRAHIHTLGGFSAHAGQSELIAWANQLNAPQPRCYLVHGEPDKMEVLQAALQQRLGWRAEIPLPGQTITL